MMSSKPKIALHWQILIGLILGIIVGLAINTMWDSSTWNSMGIDDPSAWVDGVKSDVVNQEPSAAAHAARFVRNLNNFVGDLFLR